MKRSLEKPGKDCNGMANIPVSNIAMILPIHRAAKRYLQKDSVRGIRAQDVLNSSIKTLQKYQFMLQYFKKQRKQ